MQRLVTAPFSLVALVTKRPQHLRRAYFSTSTTYRLIVFCVSLAMGIMLRVRTLPAGFIALCLQEGWARGLVASARLSALRTNGTSRIWSNSHFRREAFAVFS